MSKPMKAIDSSSLESLDKAYKTSKGYHDRERLMAIRLASQGKNTLEQIGFLLKRGRVTIARWLKSYREGGIESLLHREHKGRSASLSESDKEELTNKLLPGNWKKAKDIQTWLGQERGVDLKLGGVYYWLHRLRGSWKLPRKSHRKRNSAETERFIREIVALLEELSIPDDREIHVWVEDEHRYGLISVIRRCWTMKGHYPKAIHNNKYEWVYVYGALNLVTGKSDFIYTPTLSLEWSKEFVKQIVSTAPEAIHIILWDRAGFHPEILPEILDEELSKSVRFLPFPAYSPDLNPIEPLWNVLKGEIANGLWETLEDIETGISKALKPYWENVKQVWSLLGNTWLTRGVIVFLQRRIERIYSQYQSNCQNNIDYG
jgi:transposase